MCRCAAALTAQQRSGFSDDRQARRSAKFVWKRSLTAINALQKRFRRAKAMVVQSYKGNRLSILYLNRFGRLAHLRRAHRSGCRSKAAFVPLREAQAMSSESAVCFISLCGGVGRAEMSVCVYRRLKSAVRRIDSRALASYLRAPHNLLPAEQKLGRRRLRGGSVIVRFGRIENAGVCGASACAAACRSSMPRPLRKKQNASALFLTRRHKGVSLLHRIWNAAARRRPREAGVRGRSLRLCAGRCGIACPPLCTEASDCETEASEPIPPKPFSRFGATYRETPRQKAAKRFSLRTKNVCGAQPQMLFVHPFFFASR